MSERPQLFMTWWCRHTCSHHMFLWLIKHIFTGVSILTSMALPTALAATPPPVPTVFKKAHAKHNLFRQKHHSPPLIWNKTLQAAASHWLQRCVFEHDPDRRWGENLYLSQFTPYTNVSSHAASATQLWYNEVKSYDYNEPKYNHFTQVVWKSTKQLGCSSKYCWIYGGKHIIISCKYYPPGNYIGQFSKNVLRP